MRTHLLMPRRVIRGACRSITFIFWLALPSAWDTPATGQTVDARTHAEIEAVRSGILRGVAGTPASPDAGGVSKSSEPPGRREKSGAVSDRKSVLMNGNKITVELHNYGGIGPGYGLTRGVSNLIWRNIDYIFQFCPLVGASVPDPNNPGSRIHIVSDALNDYSSALPEVSPDGRTLWQWQPLPGYADPSQPSIASNPAPDRNGDGRPDSWPDSWYNPSLGRYVWPGYLSQDVPAADLEVFWSMDDRDNAEFRYYPFPGDSTRRGIGIQVDGRAFQWSNPLAEDCIFFVYTITNVSGTDLDSVFFGVYGDPDLGGADNNENKDDWGYFIPPYDSSGTVSQYPVYSRSMVYFWDDNGVGARGLPLGYLGCKFLESPGNPVNGIDDDGDGITDERQDDGIDNDGDWNPLQDDHGLDGVPGTNDAGEGDGIPTAGRKRPDGSLDPLAPGELNFELTDLDEADQIGLTSFANWVWRDNFVSDDERMWYLSRPSTFEAITISPNDIVFVFSSGYISLKAGETKRISMALLVGETLDDLLVSAKTVQTIYNQNYRFFRPPITPILTAVPGDRRVMLSWDDRAEESIDPITGEDFEGYVVYRSVDPSFSDIQTVTDGKGAQFLSEPLRDPAGREAKWDVATRDDPYTDLNRNGRYDEGEPYVDANGDGRYTAGYPDPWKGYHPVPYEDRGVQYFLGTNRGLVHSYVDSNDVINGQTYYYAVVAYDHGDSVGIPPTESPKKIFVDPVTSELQYDVNTAQVIPGPRASGYVPPAVGQSNVTHLRGLATGTVRFDTVDAMAVRDDHEYRLTVGDSVSYMGGKIPAKSYTVLDMVPVSDVVTLPDTNFRSLSHASIARDSVFAVTDGAGRVYVEGADYVMNYERGSIRRTAVGAIPPGGTVTVRYRWQPVFESTLFAGEDANPVFDGIRLTMVDEARLWYDPGRSDWIQGECNFVYSCSTASVGARKAPYPGDYEIRWSSQTIDSARVLGPGNPKVPVKYSVREVATGIPRPVLTFLKENTQTRNQAWDPGEEIAMFQPGAAGLPTDTLTWGLIVDEPDSSVVPDPIAPGDGDILFIATSRPFSVGETYLLRTEAARVDPVAAASRLDMVYVVPNPYVGYNEIEPKNRLPGETRGERRVYFENLPPRCTIRIFTLNGDLVQTLDHDTGIDNAREFWNLLNRDGFSVAYGIYFAHVDAPGIGETILKFAILK